MASTLTAISQRLLSPISLRKSDRISLSLAEDTKHFTVRIHSLDDDGIEGSASFNAAQIFPDRIPEKIRLSGRLWSFAATDVTVTIIDAIWKSHQIVFANDDPLTKLTYAYLLSQAKGSDVAVEVLANYKKDKTIPGNRVLHVNWADMEISESTEFSYDHHSENPLTGYQQIATHNAIRSPGYGLFMQQGTGKTPVAIAKICNEAEILTESQNGNGSPRMYRALVVAPKNVRANWLDEIEKFKTCNGKATVLRGGKMQRINCLLEALSKDSGVENKFTVVVCSYQTLTNTLEALKIIPWDLVVLDESHFVKSVTTKRTRAALTIRDSAKSRLVLTGTPIANSPLDLYSQLEFLGQGCSGFISWKAFKNFYGVWELGQYGNKLVGMQNLPFMKERLARYSFIITKDEALPDLPEKVYDVIEVVMTAEQKAAYDEVRKNLILEIESDLDRGGPNKQMAVQNALTKLLRLAQITSGFLTWDAKKTESGVILVPKEIEFFAPNPKIEALVEELKTKSDDDKTIIWCAWRPEMAEIEKRFQQEGFDYVTYHGGTSEADRATAVHRFNHDPKCKIFLGNPAAGGAGINLLGYPPGKPEGYTTNANHVIVVSQDWSSTKRSQCEDRCHRRGTRSHVRVSDLCIANTIDEEIRARVLKKRTLAMDVADVRSILKAVLTGVLDDDEKD